MEKPDHRIRKSRTENRTAGWHQRDKRRKLHFVPHYRRTIVTCGVKCVKCVRLKEIADCFPSFYAVAKSMGTDKSQLTRWCEYEGGITHWCVGGGIVDKRRALSRDAAFLGLLLTVRRKATPLYEDDRERNLEPRLNWRGCRTRGRWHRIVRKRQQNKECLVLITMNTIPLV